MIKKITDPEVQWARSAEDHELERWAKLGQTGFRQVAAEQELKRRAFWRDFWSKGIVAWLALALSIVSLVVSLSPRPSKVKAPASSSSRENTQERTRGQVLPFAAKGKT